MEAICGILARRKRYGMTTDCRPGILKNPSFSGSGESQTSPTRDVPADISIVPAISEASEDQKELTLQNTLQNAGHRRSSSAARRASATRRHSQPRSLPETNEEGENMRLKWDEANLYLAEQQKTSTMKITEPKTPYEHARDLPDEDEEEEEEDVAIDPRYVDVDELDKQKRTMKSGSQSDIPGLELGDPEELGNAPTEDEDSRIVRGGSQSREGSTGSREKHVEVAAEEQTAVGMPSREELEKHKKFEEHRKKHYEMREIKNLLGCVLIPSYHLHNAHH
jgi:protein phosphatase inhibitor 2